MHRRVLLTVFTVAIVAVAIAATGRGGDQPTAPPRSAATGRIASGSVAQPARPSVPTRADVQFPAGSLHVRNPTIAAGAGRQSLDLEVNVDRSGAGSLQVELPKRFVERSQTGLPFAGAPRVAAGTSDRVQVAHAGRSLTLDLSGARAGDVAAVEIPRVALPAGTYELPLTWRAADGSEQPLPAARVAILAGTKEPAGEEVDASNDSDEESETFDVVAPNDPSRVVTAANDIDDATSRKGVFISADGGQTFAPLLFPTQYDTSNGTVTPQLGGDPILAADGQGNIWAGGLTFCTNARRTPSRVFVVRIPAGSQSFTPKGVGLPFLHGGSSGSDCANLLQDKPMMTFGNGRLYVTWDDPDPSGGVNVVISSCDTTAAGGAARCDQAANWSAPVPVSGPPGSYITSDPAVDPSTGNVHVTWWDYSANNAIYIASCTSLPCTSQASWQTPQVAAPLDHSGVGDPPVPFACPIVAQPGGRAAPVPSLSFASDGHAYLAWSDLRAGSGATRCADSTPPAVTHLTWDSFVASAPSVAGLEPAHGTSIVGDTATGVSAANSDDWFPWVSVDASNGQAWVDVMSTTGDATRRTTHPYVRSVAAASSGSPSLGPLTQTSSTASDYSTEPCCNFGNDYGDYTGLSAAGGFPFAIWTRHRNALDDGDELVFVPKPVPPAPAPAATSTTPIPPPGQSTSLAPPPPGLGVSVPRQRRSMVLKRGLLVRVACRNACRVTLTFAVRVKKGTRQLQRRLARRTITLTGKRSLRLQITRSMRRLLRSVSTRRLLLGAGAVTPAGVRQTATRRVFLR